MMTNTNQRHPSPRRLKYPEYFESIHRRTITFSLEEETEIQQAAKQHQIKPTPFVKMASLAYIHKSYVVPQDILEQLKRLERLVLIDSNNLNQLVAQTNTLKKVTFADLYHADRILKAILDKLENFISNPPEAV
jgi:hypothetical protein